MQIPEKHVSLLQPWPDLNPRRHFDRERMEELQASLRQDGILEPLLVTKAKDPDADEDYWIVAGERRYRAALAVDMKEVPIVEREITPAQAHRMTMTENVQRESLTAMEEAWGIQKWMAEEPDLTQEEIGEQLGKSQGWVSNRLRLLNLPERIQQLVQEGVVSSTQARDLLLPLASIPEDRGRGTMWDEIHGRLEKSAGKSSERPLEPERVRSAAATAAEKITRPLHFNARIDWKEDTPDFDVEAFKEEYGTACVRYSWGRYGGSREARTWEVDAWDQWQEDAARAREESRQEAVDEFDLESYTPGDVLPEEEVFKYFDHRDRVWSTAQGLEHFLDPRELDFEALVVGEQRDWRDILSGYAIYSADTAALDTALEVGRERLKAAESAARHSALRDHRTAAEKMKPGSPAVLVPLLVALGRFRVYYDEGLQPSDIIELAERLGLDPPEGVVGSHDPHDAKAIFLAWLQELTVEQFSLLARLISWRLFIGWYDDRPDPATREARDALSEEYEQLFRTRYGPEALPTLEPSDEEKRRAREFVAEHGWPHEDGFEGPEPDQPLQDTLRYVREHGWGSIDLSEEAAGVVSEGEDGPLEDDEAAGDQEGSQEAEVQETPDLDEREAILVLVRERIEERPDVSVEELYAAAQEEHPEYVEALTLRQFNARFPLQVKRTLARHS